MSAEVNSKAVLEAGLREVSPDFAVIWAFSYGLVTWYNGLVIRPGRSTSGLEGLLSCKGFKSASQKFFMLQART